jgi:hypothetical protein
LTTERVIFVGPRAAATEQEGDGEPPGVSGEGGPALAEATEPTEGLRTSE